VHAPLRRGAAQSGRHRSDGLGEGKTILTTYVKPLARSKGQTSMIAILGMLALTGCVNLTQNASPSLLNWWPAWQTLSQPQTPPPIMQQAAVDKPAATFIVRFNDEPVLTDIGKTFRRDEAGARAKFEIWQDDHPEMHGLTLIRAGYSGELLIGLPKNDALGRSPREVLAALKGMDNMAYAETDEIAHPGTGK